MFKKQFVTISDVGDLKNCKIYFDYDYELFYIIIRSKKQKVIKSRKGDFIYG